MLFSELDLDPNVLKAVEEAGYKTPTPIQAEAIPHALKGRDILGIAQTGTGKTASFTLPMITLLAKGRARARMPRSLILCPTRELAAQVSENFETYGKYHKLTMALLIGGVSFKDQDKLIDRGVDVLIATPGRLLDHFERGKLMLTGVQIMVVDEADRMLDMGFIPDIERIFKLTPFTRQTLFFSATMDAEITKLTNEFLHNPIRVEVARQATPAETVAQSVCLITPSRKDQTESEKRHLLRALLKAEDQTLTNAIVFCNRKRDVATLYQSLKKSGLNVGALHGDLDQSVRTATLNAFRDNQITVLVASDVAARGLDIPTVSHVINFDVPIHSEDYVHRIGRTGRAGRSGRALTIATPAEQKYLEKIEALVGRPIPRIEPPAGFTAANGPAEPAAEARGDAPPRRDRRERAPRAPDTAPETAAATDLVEAELHQPETRADLPRHDETRSDELRANETRTRGGRRADERRDDARRADERRDDARRADERRGESGRRDEPRRDAPRRDGDRRPSGPRDGGAVVGMGDHVPAFLLRPVRPTERAADRASDRAGERPADRREPDPAEGIAAA